jgi:cell division inhibitor SepF
MSIFGKKPRDNYNDDDFGNDFYRGPEDEAGVLGEDDDNDLIPPMPTAQKKSAPSASGVWKVVKPHTAQDGLAIADYLVNGYTVVMNIESIDRETTVRLLDFLMGAVHVLDGEMRQVSKSTFVLSPRKGEITEDGDLAAKTESDSYR